MKLTNAKFTSTVNRNEGDVLCTHTEAVLMTRKREKEMKIRRCEKCISHKGVNGKWKDKRGDSETEKGEKTKDICSVMTSKAYGFVKHVATQTGKFTHTHNPPPILFILFYHFSTYARVLCIFVYASIIYTLQFHHHSASCFFCGRKCVI